MSNDIQVGDVCIVTDNVVEERLRGEEVTVIGVEDWYHTVKGPYFGFAISPIRISSDEWYAYAARQVLRKKLPPSKDVAEPRIEFKPADPDAWELTHWHPTKTKETA